MIIAEQEARYPNRVASSLAYLSSNYVSMSVMLQECNYAYYMFPFLACPNGYLQYAVASCCFNSVLIVSLHLVNHPIEHPDDYPELGQSIMNVQSQ